MNRRTVHIQPRKLDTPKRWEHVAEVTCSGEFPIEMLRYDCCFPRRECDAAEICSGADEVVVQIVRYTDTKAPPWTHDRWKSFGATVGPVKI